MRTSNIFFDYLETEVGILVRFRVNVLVKEMQMDLQETQGKLLNTSEYKPSFKQGNILIIDTAATKISLLTFSVLEIEIAITMGWEELLVLLSNFYYQLTLRSYENFTKMDTTNCN